MHEVAYEEGGRLPRIRLEQMHLFRVWKGERADAQQRLIAKGCLSCRSDLIEFKDAQQEAWKGLFQEQRVHCWDAEMQQGLEARAGEPRCEQSQQICGALPEARPGCREGRGLPPALPRGVWACARAVCLLLWQKYILEDWGEVWAAGG